MEAEAAAERKYHALKAIANLYSELNELEQDKIPELSKRVTSLEGEIEEEKEVLEDLEEDAQVSTGLITLRYN